MTDNDPGTPKVIGGIDCRRAACRLLIRKTPKRIPDTPPRFVASPGNVDGMEPLDLEPAYTDEEISRINRDNLPVIDEDYDADVDSDGDSGTVSHVRRQSSKLNSQNEAETDASNVKESNAGQEDANDEDVPTTSPNQDKSMYLFISLFCVNNSCVFIS